jgi:hypothetical protein
MFLGLQNIDGSTMHNIDDISQSLGILKWEVVDYEPTESRRAQLYEDRKIKYSREHAADERAGELRILSLSWSVRGLTYNISFTASL